MGRGRESNIFIRTTLPLWECMMNGWRDGAQGAGLSLGDHTWGRGLPEHPFPKERTRKCRPGPGPQTTSEK